MANSDKTKIIESKLAVDINLDTTPILYTDTVLMSTNENGVVLDVCQKLGNANRLRIVSRIGMSREHAKKIIEKLAQLLAMSEGRLQTDLAKKNKVVN